MAQWRKRSPPTNVALVQYRYGAICELILLVFAMLRGFFSVFSGFSSLLKTNTSKFQFHLDRGHTWKPARADVAFSLNIQLSYIDPQRQVLFRNICTAEHCCTCFSIHNDNIVASFTRRGFLSIHLNESNTTTRKSLSWIVAASAFDVNIHEGRYRINIEDITRRREDMNFIFEW